jgi:hypothetical protein
VTLSNSTLPEDGTSVRKHIEVKTYSGLCFMVCILWCFIERICWLMYRLRWSVERLKDAPYQAVFRGTLRLRGNRVQ